MPAPSSSTGHAVAHTRHAPPPRPADRGDVVLPEVEGYEVLDVLGRGATTEVYRVRRAATDGPDYAMKTLREPPVDADAAMLAFRREAALFACTADAGLETVHEVGEWAGRPYMIMELVDGRPLSELVREQTLQQSQLLAVAIDTATALAAAHRTRLVHRDVKPQNLLVTADGRTRLIDLGLAARTGDDQEDHVAGTFLYSPPEQTGMLARPIDGRADLYSLGVVLFECATGRPPFSADDVGELLRQHAVTAPPDVARARPDLSPTLVAIVRKLLAKDPDDRYQTAAGLVADLRRLRDHPDRPPHRLDATGGWSGADHDPPLVGRDQQVTDLVARWNRARAGHGGLAVLHGVAGTGRRRLVREVVTRVRSDGSLVLTGRCSPDELVPAGAFRRAVEDHLSHVADSARGTRDRCLADVHHAAAPMANLLATLSPSLQQLLGAETGRVHDDRQEQFAVAAARFLVELARQAGGMLLVVEDVPWLDPIGRRVLEHVTADLADAPLLVLVTAEDQNGPDGGVLDTLGPQLRRLVDTQVVLELLDPSRVEELVASQLGGVVPAEVACQLTHRAGGNPFATVEYVRSMVEAGALRPSWGSWILHPELLDELRLPSNLIDLVVARLDELDDTDRRVLLAAAVQGSSFDQDVVAEVTGLPEGEVADAMTTASTLRIIELHARGRQVFVHERLRAALQQSVDPQELAALHDRTADVLEARRDETDERVYAVARHRAAAGAEHATARTVAACVAAGRLALRQHAPQEAVSFFEHAKAAADAVQLAPDCEFHLARATALLRAARPEAADDALRLALDGERDRLVRARILHLLAQVRLSMTDPPSALRMARDGLTELGRSWPRNGLLFAAVCAGRWAAGVVAGLVRRWVPAAAGRRRDVLTTEVALLTAASDAASMRLDDRAMALTLTRSLFAVNRLGRSPEGTRVLARLGLVTGSGGLHRRSVRLFDRADAEAAALGDPALIADVALRRWVTSTVTTGRPDGYPELAARHCRWLDVTDDVMGVTLAATVRRNQGHVHEARAWLRRTAGRLDGAGPLAHNLALVDFGAQALAGEPEQAEAGLRELRASRPTVTAEQRLYSAWAATDVALEQDQLGPAFDAAVADLHATRIPTATTLSAWSDTTVAFGRLRQAGTATGHERDRRLGQAEEVLRSLRRGGRRLNLRTTWRVARAWALHLRGRDRAARRHLDRAEADLARTDYPLLAYEAARLRAHMLQAAGHRTGAVHHATIAAAVAARGGWHHRERWVREAFDLDVPITGTPSGSGTRSTDAMAGTDARLRRRLDALQEVSAAAASVVDPRTLVRGVLDVTLRILAGERAMLFLADSRDGRAGALRPHLGRDAAGNDLRELADYGTSLVERVRRTGQAIVVTGTSEGAALGSESAVVHGLRSILVAPVGLKGRLLGVLYLDSRAAKGVFSHDDGELLTVVGNQVAASLETARTAQLEVAVHTARQQRDLAEQLRASMTVLSGTLEPDQVLHRLLRTVGDMLPGEHTCLLRRDGGRLRLVAARDAIGETVLPSASGHTAEDADHAIAFEIASHPALGHVVEAGGPVAGGAERTLPPPLPDVLAQVLGAPRSWLAMPLTARGELVGVVIAGSVAADVYGELEVNVAAALAEQGTVAYDNAHLFTRVQELATTDVLTGLFNRRHFWDLGEKQLATATRHDRPLSAIMLDIDHFKRINDTRGHLVGDAVLREIAARLAATVRVGDLVGRYGGEEFAVLLPEHADAAALGERLRAAVAASPVATDGEPVAVAISVGVTAFRPGESLDDLLARADGALYAAKAAGRNRVTVA